MVCEEFLEAFLSCLRNLFDQPDPRRRLADADELETKLRAVFQNCQVGYGWDWKKNNKPYGPTARYSFSYLLDK